MPALYAPHANARDYLFEALDLKGFYEWESNVRKDGPLALITVRREPDDTWRRTMPASWAQLRCPVTARADGRKIAVGPYKDHTHVAEWLAVPEGPDTLLGCPLWDSDYFLNKLRAKHSDAELEDLFHSLGDYQKLTRSERILWDRAHPAIRERISALEYKVDDAVYELEKERLVVERLEAALAVAEATLVAAQAKGCSCGAT